MNFATIVLAAVLGGTPASATAVREITCGQSALPQPLQQTSVSWVGPRRLEKTTLPHKHTEVLLRIVNDGDLRSRIQAIQALGRHVLDDNRVKRRLLDLLEDSQAPEPLRAHVVKVLALPLSQDWRIQQRVLRIAISESQSSAIRATAYRALHVVACKETPVRQALHVALNGDEAPLREAAAWALFADSAEPSTRNALLGVAKDSSAPAALRVEAIRSLHGALGEWDVQFSMYQLAQAASLEAHIREAAILSLQPLGHDQIIRMFLMETAEAAKRPVIRQAAIRALGEMTWDLARFFHVPYYFNTPIDHLERY